MAKINDMDSIEGEAVTGFVYTIGLPHEMGGFDVKA